MTTFLLEFLSEVYLPTSTPSILQEKACLTSQYLDLPELLVQSQLLIDFFDRLVSYTSASPYLQPTPQFFVHKQREN